MNSIERVPELVKRLYATVEELEGQFPGRKFSLDGHLVGSIGEVLAAHRYGLQLLCASNECHDAVSAEGIHVQIKATQVGQVGIRREPEHLIVLRLHRDGTAEEVFNGPGLEPWQSAGKMQKNGQRPISLSKLRQLMQSVPDDARLAAIGH